MRTSSPSPVGVLLMTFGTARTADEVPAYLSSVRGGREVPEELVEEFRRRFQRVGGSPLIELTQRQAEALERHLNSRADVGESYLVHAGMRHSHPTILEALADLQEHGATPIIGIIMSPQYSPRIMGGYVTAFDQARAGLGMDAPARVAEDWHDVPDLIEALAEQLCAALTDRALDHDYQVIFTAHSLPRSVADDEPEYLEALRATAQMVAARVGVSPQDWCFAYQSAGHTREEWLKPDLVDLFPELRKAGVRRVIIAPVQFLADHLEVLYDIDVAAAEQAEAAGLTLSRIASLNDASGLIAALGLVVKRELAAL